MLVMMKKLKKNYLNILKMEFDKPVIVFITAKTCLKCVSFKKTVIPELRDKIKNLKNVEIDYVDYETTIPTDKENVHPDIVKFIKFFPSVMIFPKSLWKNHNRNLKGITYGVEKNSIINNIKINTETIHNWILENINDNMFSSTIQVKDKKPLVLNKKKYVTVNHEFWKGINSS